MTSKPTGVVAHLASSTVATINTDIETIKIGELLEYHYDDLHKQWLNENNQPVSGIMGCVASFSIATMSSDIESLRFGQVVGFYPVDTFDAEGNILSTVWYSSYTDDGDESSNVLASGLMLSFANLKMKDIGNTQTVAATVQTVTIAQALSMEERTDGWYVDGARANNVLAALAETEIGDLNNAINGMKLGTIFGYTEGANGKWYTDANCTNLATGVLGALAGTSIDGIETKMNNMFLGEIFGYTQGANGKWYTDANCTSLATGVLAAFAGLTINQMSDNNAVQAAIKTVTIGEVMGYHQADNGKWYTDSTETTEVSPIMAAVAGAKVSEVEATIQATNIGILLGYHQNDAGKWFDSNNQPITGITAAIAGTPVNELSDRMQNMTVADIFGYVAKTEVVDGVATTVWYESDETTKVKGMMLIIGPNTKVSAIDDRSAEMFDNDGIDDVTIGQMMDAGVLTIDSASIVALDTILGTGWRNTTLDAFVNLIINTMISLYYN